MALATSVGRRMHDGRVETEKRKIHPVLGSAVVVLANLSVLMVVSESLAVHRDNDPNLNSGSPVTDGTDQTILVVVVLLIVNAALLCLWRGTRRIGLGALLGVLAAIPVGIVVSVFALTSLLAES